VQVGAPEGAAPPDLDEEPQLTAPVGPDIDPEMFLDVAAKLFPEMKGKKKADAAPARASKGRGRQRV
jgi:hypothetical protein